MINYFIFYLLEKLFFSEDLFDEFLFFDFLEIIDIE